MTVAIRCSEENLVGLFLGDDDTTGYAHPALVRELCVHWRPVSIGELAGRMYPDVPMRDLPKAVRVALREGLTLWRSE